MTDRMIDQELLDAARKLRNFIAPPAQATRDNFGVSPAVLQALVREGYLEQHLPDAFDLTVKGRMALAYLDGR